MELGYARKRRRGALAVLLAGSAAALSSAPPALAVQVTCGQTISQDTKVSNNLEDCPGNGLVIDASDVTLDLRGHTIDGDDSGSGDGIFIRDDNDDVIVKNGTVRQFRDGLSVGNNGSGHRLLGLRLADHVDDGIEIDGGNTDALFRSILAIGNGVDGVHFDSGGGATSGLVFQGITAKGNTNQGFDIRDLDDALIERSSARDNGADGLRLDSDSTGSLIRDFVSQDNTADGFVISGSDNTLLRVSALRNDLDGINFIGAGNKLLRSLSLRNGDEGVLVAGGSADTLLSDNVASRNVQDGFEVNDAGTTLRRNTANDNDEFGINAVAGVTDLGGNKAKGNDAAPPQCVNVSC